MRTEKFLPSFIGRCFKRKRQCTVQLPEEYLASEFTNISYSHVSKITFFGICLVGKQPKNL